MSEMPLGSEGPAGTVPPAGARPERGYVRFAVIGDASGRGRPSGSSAWAVRLADVLGRRHVVSMCDLARRGATAYDTRRVQLREAVTHRAHIVALTPGFADVKRRDWEGEAVRAHLLHCAMVLSQHGATVLTVRLDPRQRGIGRLRPTRRRRRARIEAINSALAEIDRRYGGIHLVPSESRARVRAGARLDEIIERLAATLSADGFLFSHS